MLFSLFKRKKKDESKQEDTKIAYSDDSKHDNKPDNKESMQKLTNDNDSKDTVIKPLTNKDSQVTIVTDSHGLLSKVNNTQQETNIRLRDIEERLRQLSYEMAKQETLEAMRSDVNKGFERSEDYFKRLADKDKKEAEDKMRSSAMNSTKARIIEIAKQKELITRQDLVELGIVKAPETASSYLKELAQSGHLIKIRHGEYQLSKEAM